MFFSEIFDSLVAFCGTSYLKMLYISVTSIQYITTYSSRSIPAIIWRCLQSINFPLNEPWGQSQNPRVRQGVEKNLPVWWTKKMMRRGKEKGRETAWYANHQCTVFENHRKVSFNIAKWAKFTFWVDKSSLKMPQIVNFGEFLKNLKLAVNQCYQT